MSTDTMVSLDNFYLFNEPHSYASNSHYIGSDTIKVLGSFLIGANKLYRYKTTNLWILKGLLKDNILLLDNSFDDPDFLNEQLAILEFVGRPAKVQYECLWTYFNLPSIEEINRISLQVTQRKVDEFTNPEKVHYYKCLDKKIFNGTYDEWIVEMDVLFEKWKDCERVRLTERGHTTSQIEYYIHDKNIIAFKRQYANDQITFYTSQRITNPKDAAYFEALNFLRTSTGLGEAELCKNMDTGISDYLSYITRFMHSLSNEDVVRYATTMYEHHKGEVEVLAVTQDQYENSLLILVEATNMDVPTILPEDSEDLNTYIRSVRGLFSEEDNINLEDVDRHAIVVYNYHRSVRQVVLEELEPEVIYPF